MDQRDHIATLCVAGTVGIAATGLALGVQTGKDSTHSTTPGKRKWPGASSLMSHSRTASSLPQRRVVSQPSTSTAPAMEERQETLRSTSLFRRQSKRDSPPTNVHDTDVTGSRGSSMNRSGMFRPRTSDTRSTSARRDPSTGSSWLKRISTVSSPRASSPSAASSSNQDTTPQSTSSLTPDSSTTVPNKLVKRSTSHKALSHDHARGTFLRRPATSHQRSATVQEWTPREISFSTPATPYLSSESGPIWRPFFEPGYPRKRHTATSHSDSLGPRVVSASMYGQPTLILGSQLDARDTPDDQTEKILGSGTGSKPILSSRQRLKRSLSSVQRASRRRHVTDPTVKVTTEAVNGTMTPAVAPSPLSPNSFSLPFETNMLHRSPSFNSSPPMIPARHRFSFRKRQSTAPSDPTTTSSDVDTRIFSDDDSMDFQSDTAYDSLTTRATASSHSAYRTPKLDTIFNEPHVAHGEDAALASLMQQTTVADDMMDTYSSQQTRHLRGIGITNYEAPLKDAELLQDSSTAFTPIKPKPSANNEYNMTPVPHRLQHFGSPKSSPPALTQVTVNGDLDNSAFVLRPRLMEDDIDDLDWSPKSDKQEKQSTSTLRPSAMMNTSVWSSSPGLPSNQNAADFADEQDNESDKRLSSIFDWSENQKVSVDGLSSNMIRPKTVHGKQGNDGSRSRSSGRKAPTQVHLRSQSVPNNRDPNAEQTPLSTSKFGTWGLGHKPISEEWSDDFEFDDMEENESLPMSSNVSRHDHRRISRGVKVPQSIIDRQASVHLQFGQVQEFMLLVEELKQLRARGAALHLLETQPSHHWDDAESIIELATINNEEDDTPVRPSSPTSSDIFGDELLDAPKTGPDRSVAGESMKNLTSLRTASSPATPSHGRPRGESLAQAKTFLQSIHQSRSGMESSPSEFDNQPHEKFPFDTQDLKDLVVRSGLITRALKEIIRKAEGLSISPSKTPPVSRDPVFSQIFNAPDRSPCPPFRKPGIPKSRSANSYPFGTYGSSNGTVATPSTPLAMML